MRRTLQAHIDSVVFVVKAYLEWTLTEWERKTPSTPFRLCEIGVCTAGNASRALGMCPSLEYVGIDPWDNNKTYLAGLCNHKKTIGREALKDQQRWDEIYEHAQNAIAFAGERACLVRARSPEAATLFPDEHFTMVYLDGDHGFDAVSRDLEAWYPKVVPGGWFAGDDYLPRKPRLGVRRAVDAWFTERKMKFEVFGLQTWWCQKPEVRRKK